MKISVIIPVYNVEQYLPACIESVLKQTYNNIEIILVDDGSTDQSGKMCDFYKKQDDRINVIHQLNGGLSSARNAGIKLASGDFITFVDSDDYVSGNYIEYLVELCKRYDADISIMGMCFVSSDSFREISLTENENIVLFSPEEAIEQSLYQKMFTCCAPGKLYKREIFDEIIFPVGRLSEDLAVCHLLFDSANKVVFSNQYGYFYRQREKSIMHVFHVRRMDALYWAKEIEKYCEKKHPNIKDAAICRTFNVAIHLILELPDNGKSRESYYNTIWREICRTRRRVVFSKKCRKREKMAALISYGGEKILKKIWNSAVAVKQKEYY